MAAHRHAVRPCSRDPAVELRDAKAPGFLFVGRFEREHVAPLLVQLSLFNVSRV